MRSAPRRLLRLGAFAGAGLATERLLARRVRSRTRSDDHLLVPPAGVRHLTVPTEDDDGSLHLLEHGTGQPVLLVHGITLNAELWSPQLHGLADDFRVISLDQRGHGRSVAGTEGFSMSLLGRDIATVLTRLNLRDVLLVGHSMGGMAALNFAIDHPDVLRDRVAGLGLVATAASRPVAPLIAPRAAAFGSVIIDRLDNGRPVRGYRFGGNDLSLFLVRSVFGAAPSAAAIEQVRASVEATDQETIQRLLGAIMRDHDAVDRLGEIDVPAFVVVGARDILTPPMFARQMVDGLPDAELTVLPRAGHQLMQERPVEVDGLIRDLAARSGEPPLVAARRP